jgi:hypothetical protein
MPALNNARHERFAQGLAKGLTGDKAYSEAGYKPNRKNAARLKSNEDVKSRVKEIAERAATRVEIDRAWVMDMLRKNAERCLDDGDDRNPNAGNRALELLGKEIGMFVDRRLLGVRRIEDMSEEELLALLGGEPDPDELGEAAGATMAGGA